MKYLAACAITLIAFLWPRPLAGKDLSIAYLEIADRHTQRADLAGQLKRIGLHGSFATPKIHEGRCKLTPYDVLLVGSFALSDPYTEAWFRREGASLRRFVARGGVVLVLTQESDVWDIEPWLPETAFLLRGNRRFRKIGYLEEGHPLFRAPNPISLDRLNSAWQGDEKWPGRFLSWWSFRTARPALLLAAQNAKGEHPWCVEMGWGRGRVLLLACAPDKVPEDQPESTRKLADALLQNLLAYAGSVQEGKPYPLPEGTLIGEEDVERRIHHRRYSVEEERAFDRRVNAAVDRGITYLKTTQKEDGSWGTFGYHNGPYKVGLTALSLLALLNSGVSKFDPAVEKGFRFILENPPTRTYEIGLTLMAMEVRAAPMYERFELEKMPLDQRASFEFKRDLTEEDRDFMQGIADRLIASQARGGCWKYDPEVGGGDVSNGQFATLGLKAAARCGVRVPRDLWAEVIKYFINYQEHSGPKVKVPEFKSYARDGKAEFYMSFTEARGWGYDFGLPQPDEVKGSRVNIGICSLILAYEELVKMRAPEGSKNRPKVREGVRGGLGWLHGNWCIDTNPVGPKHHYYYYIYSLERVGVLTGKRFIGDHDWYREGAAYLMEKQEPDGAWVTQANEWGSAISNTGFALLFLKRSTPPPVITAGH